MFLIVGLVFVYLTIVRASLCTHATKPRVFALVFGR